MKIDATNIKRSDRIARYRKENGFYRQISMICPRDGLSIVTARFYWPGRDGMSNCYCCVWIHGDSCYGLGAGKAGGYGYHKESAALGEALRDAGLVLSEDINGCGDSAMYDALDAAARAVTGRRKFYRVMAHG